MTKKRLFCLKWTTSSYKNFLLVNHTFEVMMENDPSENGKHACVEIWQTPTAFFLFMDETIIDEQQNVVEKWMNGEIPGV